MVITSNVKFEHLKWVKHDKIIFFAIQNYAMCFLTKPTQFPIPHQISPGRNQNRLILLML